MKFIMIAMVTLMAAMSGAVTAGDTGKLITKNDIDGIVNYSKIIGPDGFAGSPVGMGGATDPEAMAALKDQGFSTVVNLRLASEEGVDVAAGQDAAAQAGLNYIHFPFNSSQPGATDVEDFLAIIGDQANHPVYVHCGSATRAAALWMIGRVLRDGWTPEQATAEVQQIAGKPDSAVTFATQYLSSR